MCSEDKLEFNVNNWCKTVCREDFSISAKLYVENVHLYMYDTRNMDFISPVHVLPTPYLVMSHNLLFVIWFVSHAHLDMLFTNNFKFTNYLNIYTFEISYAFSCFSCTKCVLFLFIHVSTKYFTNCTNRQRLIWKTRDQVTVACHFV